MERHRTKSIWSGFFLLLLCKSKQSLPLSAAWDRNQKWCGWAITPQAPSPLKNRSSQSNLTSVSQPNGLFGQPTSWATSVKSCVWCCSCEATVISDLRSTLGLPVIEDFCPSFNLFSGSQGGGKGVLSPQGKAVLTHSAIYEGGPCGFSPLSIIGEHVMSPSWSWKKTGMVFISKHYFFNQGFSF